MSVFSGEGIIKNSQRAVDMAKVEAMREEIEMVIVRKTITSDREITIEQIIEQLEKQGIINSGDGNSETGQVKTQPDGYVYEIKEKANGDWEVTYIGTGELTLPEILISLSANTTGITNQVTITMVAKAESGITSYILPKGTEQSVESGTKEITTTYTATENGTYTVTVTNGNGKTESKSITIDNILEGTIQISADPTTSTTGNVTVTITWPSETSRAIKEIQIGEGSWQTCTGETTTLDVMINCTIKARIRNSTEDIKTATCDVNNIDRKAPKTFTPTVSVTSNSITLSGSTEDEEATTTNGSSGIGAYYFQIDGGNWLTNTNPLDESYTFVGLTQGTSHTLKMKAVDKAGNEIITDSITATTINLPTVTAKQDFITKTADGMCNYSVEDLFDIQRNG